MTADWQPIGIDTQTPSTARMYDYFLGGKHHYPVDREAAEDVLAAIPDLSVVLRENRKFLQRAVRLLAEAGIRQFLDLGTGLPTQENVHQVAQAIRPDARVVYVDNDPVTLAHAQALLVTDTQTTVIDADLRYPQQVLAHPDVHAMLHFDEPIALMFVSMLHFIGDDEEPSQIVATFRDAVASGSYLAISHGTADDVSSETATKGVQPYEQATSTMTPRTYGQIRDLFGGFEILDPGIVPVDQWRRGEAGSSTVAPSLVLAGLGYKP